MSLCSTSRRFRGVSLIEALVALAIMAIGMLGIVGVQSTLRTTSDLAKQRSEAVRIAQVEIERWRGFTAIAGGAGTNFDDLPDGVIVDPTIDGINAVYTRSRSVTSLPPPRAGKSLAITVTWQDRTGQDQRVDLSTLIAGITPELGLTLVVPGTSDVIQQPMGRKGGIPLGAKDLGGGRSGWIPPGSPTGVAWVFNNITGVITLCTTTAAAVGDLIYNPDSPGSDNVVCSTTLAMYVSGYVRYALDPTQPVPANATNPPSKPNDVPALDQVTVEANYVISGFPLVESCYVRHNNFSTSKTSDFYCAVPVFVIPGVPPSWSGYLAFGPASVISATASDAADSRMRVCRYHAAATYSIQKDPLANQNFLLIRSGDGGAPPVAYTCPTPLSVHLPT